MGGNPQGLTSPDLHELLDIYRQRIVVWPKAAEADRIGLRKAGSPEPTYTVRVLKGPHWKELCRIPDLPDYHFQASPDGRFLFAANTGHAARFGDRSPPVVRIFDLTTGRETAERIPPKGIIQSFTPDGRYALVMGSTMVDPKAIGHIRRYVWDPTTGAEVRDEFGRVVEDLSWFTGGYRRYRLSKSLVEACMEIPFDVPTNTDGLRIQSVNLGGFSQNRTVLRVYDGSPFAEPAK